MSAITWQNIPEHGREHETIGDASLKTAYYIWDHGEGVFLATVRVKMGVAGTTNFQVRAGCKGLDDAKAACEADFAACQRS